MKQEPLWLALLWIFLTITAAMPAALAEPVITSQPTASQVVNSGSSFTFSVSVTGSDPLSYQWFHNGLPIAGGTESSLTIDQTGYSDRGVYQVKVTDATGTQASDAGFLNVLLNPPHVRGWGDNSKGQSAVPTGLSGVVAIAAGNVHSLTLKADGTVVAWGDNSRGQSTVPTGLSGVVAIAAGYFHSLALTSDGTVHAWGDNSSGQCAVPSGLTGVVAISAGYSYSLALKSDGTVVGWGSNPVPGGLGGVVAISAGYYHGLALRSDGSVVAWGDNSFGQCSVPAGLKGVVAVSGGAWHSLLLKSDGTVLALGDTSAKASGQSLVPSGLGGVVAIAAGAYHSLALKSNGTVVGWGDYHYGQTATPAGLTGVVAISAGAYFNLALNPTAPPKIAKQPAGQTVTQGQSVALTVTATGDDLSYQWKKDGLEIAAATNASLILSPVASTDAGTYSVVVGNEAGTVESSPAQLDLIGPSFASQPVQSGQIVTTGTEVVFSVAATGSGALTYQWFHNGMAIAGGTDSSLVLSNVGLSDQGIYLLQVSDSVGTAFSNAAFLNVWDPLTRVRGWGGDYHVPTVPIGVAPKGAVAVSTGAAHELALQSDGTVLAWGDNSSGQCAVPTGLAGVVAVAAGGTQSLALKSDGTVVGWGTVLRDYFYSVPCPVPAGLTGVIAIAAGGTHCLALKSDGTVVAWGYDSNGQCKVPTGLTGVTAIAAGRTHSLALKSDGTVVAWGYNSNGQCTVPAGLTGVVAIAAGSYHSLALKADGTLVAWGNNGYGQCTVPAGLTGVTAISAGYLHSVALKPDGHVVAWGDNSYGQCSVPASLGGVVALSSGGYANLAISHLLPVQIIAPPVSQTVGQGQSVELAVSATGSELAYQWRLNGVDIPGATKSTLSFTKAEGTDDWQYSVVVSNDLGSVESDPVQVTLVGPTFPPQPVQSAQMVNPGTEVTFSVAATGSGDLAYQWLLNGIPITGATNSVLTVGNAGYSDRGVYQVRVSDSTGTAISEGAFLNVWESANHVQEWGFIDQRSVPQGLAGVAGIGAGFTHMLALKSDGKVVAWGDNSLSECAIPAGLDGVAALAGGGYYSLALKTDGTVVGWTVTWDGRSIPPAGLTGVVAVKAGAAHSLALRSGGGVVAWGNNAYGQSDVPAGLTGVVAIAAGGYHSLALKSDGTVIAWGLNSSGQCTVPTGLTGVIAIAAGRYHSLAVKSDGTVVGWGENNKSDQCTPPPGLEGVVAVAAGSGHSLALKADGTVVAWGDNSYGQCALPNTLAGVVSLAAGDNFSLVLTHVVVPKILQAPLSQSANQGQSITLSTVASGNELSYQWKKDGIVIPGATSDSLTLPKFTQADTGSYTVEVSNTAGSVESDPAQLTIVGPTFPLAPQQSTQVATTGTEVLFSVEATGSGTLAYQWFHNGRPITGATNSFLKLESAGYCDRGTYRVRVSDSEGTAISDAAFLNVMGTLNRIRAWGSNDSGQCTIPAGLSDPVEIATGYSHSLALKADGTVVAWGANWAGQCTVPNGLSGVVAIEGGGSHSLALKADRTVVAWGDNIYGQTTVPTGLKDVIAIAAGWNHSLALKSDGTVVGWGDHSYGQTTAPAGLSGVIAIAAGENYSLALKSDGTVVAWGNFCDGNTTSGLSGVVAIAAKKDHSLALKSDGTVVAWGNSALGQTSVPSGLAGVTAIAAGGGHNLVLRANESITGWGKNDVGQITVPIGVGGAVGISAGYSHSLALEQISAPKITSQPVALSLMQGQAGSFSVSAQGGALGYQWKKNGDAIPGATEPSLALPYLTSTDAGVYTVTISNELGSVTSDPVNLTLVGPSFPPHPAQSGQVVTPGTRVVFSVNATGSGTVSYQWLHNGLPIASATGSSLAIGSAQCSDGGYYVVKVADSQGSVTSLPAFLSISIPKNSVIAWGANGYGQCTVPADLRDVVALSAGWHSLALKADGTVVAWGANWAGQSDVPPGLTGVVAIAAGEEHSLALKADGTVVAWGKNDYGQTNVPAGLAGVAAIAAGGHHSLALKADGTVVFWGYDGAKLPSGLTEVVGIAAGTWHSLALKSDGTVISKALWSDSPVAGPTGVRAIAAGGYNNLALKSDGTVFAWNYGVDLYGLSNAAWWQWLSGVVGIAAGWDHSLVIKADGGVFAWGSNDYGQKTLPANLNRVVAVAAGTEHSLALGLVVTTPRIISQPASVVTFQGRPVTFSVTATGGALSFQWMKDGKILDLAPTTTGTGLGAISTFTLDHPGPSDLGTYTVLVSNDAGSATSQGASLSIPVFTGETTSTTYFGTRLNGTLNPGGMPTTYYFEYGETTSYGTTTLSQDAGSGSGEINVSATIAGLKPRCTYHWRLVIVNSGGTQYGEDRTFTTNSRLPLLGSAAPISATYQSVVVNGALNPNGLATTLFLESGTSAAYRSRTRVRSSGAGTALAPFSVALSGLKPGTTYHGRIVAVNRTGTTKGNDFSFTTLDAGIAAIVAEGESAPCSADLAAFASFGSPAINANLDVAFFGKLSGAGIDAKNSEGIWVQSGTGGRCEMVAQTGGEAALAYPRFKSLSDPVLSANGEVGFFATVVPQDIDPVNGANGTGIWSYQQGYLSCVVMTGYQLPVAGGLATVSALNHFALTDTGGIVFEAKLLKQKGLVDATNNEGIWSADSSGEFHSVIQKGDTLDGKKIASILLFSPPNYVGGQTRGFTPSGDLIVKVTFTDKTQGLYLITSVGVTSLFVGQNQETGSGARFASFGIPAMNASKQVAFTATISGSNTNGKNNTGIWLAQPEAESQLIARTSGPAPLEQGNGTFSSLADPVCDNGGRVAFLATLKTGGGVNAANSTGLWVATSGTLQLIARSQTQAPDCPQGALFSKFKAFALPDQGGLVILADLAGKGGVTGTNNEGIWAVNTAGQLRLVVREGDTQIIHGESKTISSLSIFGSTPGTPGQSRSFNSPGDLTYKATFTDKTEAVYRVVFP